MKPTIPELKKQLVDEGGDIDAMIAEFPDGDGSEDILAEEKTETSEPSAEATPPEVHAVLMKYGPPDRWSVDIMKENKPDLLKRCSDAWEKMPESEKAEIQKAWEKKNNMNPRPPGTMTMRME